MVSKVNDHKFIPDFELARDIVEPHLSKPLSQTRGLDLARTIESLVKLRTSQMLTYGPDEIARIGSYTGLTVEQVSNVINAAGGSVVDAEGVVASWARSVADHQRRDILAERRAVIADEIKMLLHASRDSLRRAGVDTATIPFSMNNCYYAEAFGMIRALEKLDLGYMGTNINVNKDGANLRAFFFDLEQQVLGEEGYFDGTHACEYCRSRYGTK